jgi:hypothetical protein
MMMMMMKKDTIKIMVMMMMIMIIQKKSWSILPRHCFVFEPLILDRPKVDQSWFDHQAPIR